MKGYEPVGLRKLPKPVSHINIMRTGFSFDFPPKTYILPRLFKSRERVIPHVFRQSSNAAPISNN